MSKYMISDAAMQEACGMVREKMLASLRSCETPEFSDGFQERMQELNRCAVRSARLHSLRRKSVAAVVVLFLCLGAFLTFSPDARADVMERYKYMLPGNSWYWFLPDGAYESGSYAPGWLPEGYELVRVDVDSYESTWQVRTYQCAGEQIIFQSSWLGGGNVFSVRTEEEYTEVVSVAVNGLPGDLYISADPEQAHYLVWVDEDAKMLFCICAQLDTEDMLRIAESVDLVD